MPLHETDFYRWTKDTSEKLRRGAWAGIDLCALAEEVEDMGKKEKAAFESRQAVLISHLWKWDLQPARRSRSWQATIQLQRNGIERLLEGSRVCVPSYRRFWPRRTRTRFCGR